MCTGIISEWAIANNKILADRQFKWPNQSLFCRQLCTLLTIIVLLNIFLFYDKRTARLSRKNCSGAIRMEY